MPDNNASKKMTYADSGVDIAAGDEAVERIMKIAERTFNSSVLGGVGTFGGMFRPDFGSLKSPVLISSTDSVGTKVKLAFMTGRHNTVGEDLVNHCVNDILVHGARPLFFLDYIGINKVKLDVVEELVSGIARGCEINQLALLGGETAELPDLYHPNEYDLVGFIVGMLDESKIIDGSAIVPGDICIGLSSNGLHTNGYSLARRIAFEVAGLKAGDRVDELDDTIDSVLMCVHRSYASIVHPLLERFNIHGMAHITGGGIPGNLKRIIPDRLSAVIHKDSWPVLRIFKYLAAEGNIPLAEQFAAFNMGIGFVLVLPSAQADAVLSALAENGEQPYRIGEIVAGGREKVALV